MEIREESKMYENLAKEVINEEKELSYIKNSNVRIAYLESDKEKKSKGKLVFGECEKVADKNKWGIPYDFTITLFGPNVAGFDKRQLKVLLFHELLHIGVNEETGKFSIVPHELEDFKLIIDRFGTEWAVTE